MDSATRKALTALRARGSKPGRFRLTILEKGGWHLSRKGASHLLTCSGIISTVRYCAWADGRRVRALIIRGFHPVLRPRDRGLRPACAARHHSSRVTPSRCCAVALDIPVERTGRAQGNRRRVRQSGAAVRRGELRPLPWVQEAEERSEPGVVRDCRIADRRSRSLGRG